MKKIKIRTRIMLWFTLLSAALLGLLVPLVYTAAAASFRQTMQADLQMTVSRAFGAMEQKDGNYYPELEELDLPEDCSLAIISPEGELIYENGNAGWLADKELQPGENTFLRNGRSWAAQMQIFEIEETKLRIVAASSTEYAEKSLRNLILLLLFLVPLYLGASALGAFFLAKRALRPIHRITQTAKTIGSGDLSNRIPGVPAGDEVGELAETFNEMLDKLEVSFCRERQFTSDASHELRTPITVISACAEDALSGNEGEIRDNLEMIETEAGRMAHILSQLLMLSRGYEGRHHFEPDQISLYDMADSVSEELRGAAEEMNIAIHNDVPEDLEIRADQSLMTQLFVNLVGNAIKYGRPGGNIWLRAEREKDAVRIEAADDGIGISEEDLPHVFERFYRADKARDRSGSGLGLAIVKWIAQMHGGMITVKSSLGHGTIFTLKLPA